MTSHRFAAALLFLTVTMAPHMAWARLANRRLGVCSDGTSACVSDADCKGCSKNGKTCVGDNDCGGRATCEIGPQTTYVPNMNRRGTCEPTTTTTTSTTSTGVPGTTTTTTTTTTSTTTTEATSTSSCGCAISDTIYISNGKPNPVYNGEYYEFIGPTGIDTLDNLSGGGEKCFEMTGGTNHPFKLCRDGVDTPGITCNGGDSVNALGTLGNGADLCLKITVSTSLALGYVCTVDNHNMWNQGTWNSALQN